MTSRFRVKSLFLAFSSIAVFSFAQTKISGKVSFRNKAIKEVNVSLKDSYDGATTDVNGWFSFNTDEKGIRTLVFSNPNYEDVEKTITIESSDIDLSVIMKEFLNEINAVVITAGSIEASDKKRATALLKPIDIYTTAGADGQITAALGYLPGVQKVGESEGLFVRGGSAGETKIYIDGSLVNNFFSQSTPGLAGRDRFNTSLFKGNIFSSGGYSAVYGQALSSVLILESVDLPSTTSYDFSVSPLFVGANYQNVNDSKTASWGISTTYSNLGLMTELLNFNTDFSKSPEGLGLDANFRIKTKKGGFIKYYTNFQLGNVGVNGPSLESNFDKTNAGLQSRFNFHSLSYREKLGAYKLDFSTSYTFNQNNLDLDAFEKENVVYRSKMDTKGNYFNAKAIIGRKINRISTLRGGLEFNNSIEDSQYDFQKKHYTDLVSAAFVESNLAINRSFSFSVGARSEYSTSLKKWNISPRFSAAYKISDNWMSSLAYGRFYQNPDSKYINSSTPLDYQSADHYIFQIQHNSEGRSLRLETFYKEYDKLIKTNGTLHYQTAINNSGHGFAQGFEVFWRDQKTLKSLDYWLTYSYLDTQREFLHYPQELTPSFAAKHTVSAVAKRFVMAWKTGFNLSYTYASGRPYYDFDVSSLPASLRTKGHLKDYNALNFSLNYVPSAGRNDAKFSSVYVLGINNILANKNVYGYNYSQDGMRRNSVLPAYDRFIFIGAFFSFGIDKTNDAINNNL